MAGRGLIIAAPSSRSGKTTVTLGLVRALVRQGRRVSVAKAGPDYIDPGYLAAAAGADCPNLDAWAMTDDRLQTLARTDDLLIVEGAMGLFDGAPPDGHGSAADLAKRLGLPVVLVIDCGAQSQSVAALARGFCSHDSDVSVAGLILNNVGSDRHEALLRDALRVLDPPVFGVVRRQAALSRPSRHLGLVQAQELEGIDAWLDEAATGVGDTLDLAAITAAAAPMPPGGRPPRMPPLAQSIAVARDAAFGFVYPHMLSDWTSQGVTIRTFSPLADEPPPEAEAIFLPGGYPELHAKALARAGRFRTGMAAKAQAGATIYGECGGYMVLGQTLTDASGVSFPMLGLLDLETSFARRRLHLGYRTLVARSGPFSGSYRGHEFHYASTVAARGAPLFAASDATGAELPAMGLVSGTVSGSFAHIIDRAEI